MMAAFIYKCVLLLLPVLLQSSCFAQQEALVGTRKRIDIILIGATSSLARKYLWQSFFKAFLEEELKENPRFEYHLYGGATRPVEEGSVTLKNYLETSTTCQGIKDIDLNVCEAKLKDYRSRVQYVQLRGEALYSQLGRKLQEEEKHVPLEGRLFYLAISPDLYPMTAKYISQYLRPSSDSKHGAWLRVVFEKPFGRDLVSAESLAKELSVHLKEEEIYRVDHYMGKTVVQAILPFREANKEWLEKLWNADQVKSFEVAMKETEDCQGRTSFYEGYGVIRDVLQNHLTQVLVLLKMDLPPEKDSVYGSPQHRTTILKSLKLMGEEAESRATIQVGQYEGYLDHVAEDRKSERHFIQTKVPTAASVKLGSQHPRWEGVEFILKAGKGLDDRTSYAKVTLKRGHVENCQILFNIQGGALGTAIAWNRSSCQGVVSSEIVRTPPGWVESDDLSQDLHILRPKDAMYLPNAYDVVVEEVLEGDRSMFLDTEELLHQWSMWDPILRVADEIEPSTYPFGFDVDEMEAVGLMKNTIEEKGASLKVEL